MSMIVPAIIALIDKVIPDAEANTQAKIKLLELEQSGELARENNQKELLLAQADVAKTEAQHESLFVAGARPSIIWVASAGLAWQYIGYPITQAYLDIMGKTVLLTKVNEEILLELVVALLGIGTLRTIDKRGKK